MKIFKLLIYLFIILNFTNSIVNAKQNVAFADIDLILKNTKIGKLKLDKISKLNKSNIETLKNFEKEIKIEEDKINKKKNLISEDEYQKELNKLKTKIKNFNIKKNEMVNNFKNEKNKELENLLAIINPIIQEYMKENSIEILLNSKNIFMGKKEIDLTEMLIKEIDEKIVK
tara:strand:+ start:1565 stop:2080 length:516 start_codon:yes stop_codon:yes gene_type:complete